MKDTTLLIGAGVGLAAALMFTRRAAAAAASPYGPVNITPAAGWFPRSITAGEPNYSARKTDTDATLAGTFAPTTIGYSYTPSF